LRSKVGVIYGSPEVTSGGNALKFFASVRLDTRRKEILADNLGIKVKVKVVKNKVAAPFQTTSFDILFESGIDTHGCILDAATDLNIVQRRGSWYAIETANFAQGRANAIVYMRDNPDFTKDLDTKVRQAMAQLKKPTSVDVDEEAMVDDSLSGVTLAEVVSEGIEGFD